MKGIITSEVPNESTVDFILCVESAGGSAEASTPTTFVGVHVSLPWT